MKRSEMLEVIQEYIEIRDEGEVWHGSKDAAEYILGCCETWGMLPPPKEVIFPYNERLREKGIIRMVADYTSLNKWEGE